MSVIITRPPRHHYIHPSKEKACPHTFLNILLAWSSHRPPMPQWVKMLVSQWGIEAYSLAIQVRATRSPIHSYISNEFKTHFSIKDDIFKLQCCVWCKCTNPYSLFLLYYILNGFLSSSQTNNIVQWFSHAKEIF